VSRKEREQKVSILSKRIRESKGMIVLDYTGLNVEKITDLRRQIKGAGSEVKVAKNTLIRIATKDSTYEQLQDYFAGQTALTFIDGDPALLAKVLTKFAQEVSKDSQDTALKFKIRAGMLDASLLLEDDIKQLGDLPSRDVLLGQFVGMLASPLTGFVSVLADVPRKFLRVLTAIADQKKDN